MQKRSDIKRATAALSIVGAIAIVIGYVIVSHPKDAPAVTSGGGDVQSLSSPAKLSLPTTLLQARSGFQTKLTQRLKEDVAPDAPPAGLFELASYPSSVGELVAYLSPDPGDGKKHPAIIWLAGGFSNSIGGYVWENAPPTNDQSASAFRKAGIIMLYPSLRGGNQNPGIKEAFLGEVDDVLAAAEFLAKQPGVDPKRIYLGGHSTGGTLALLAAECSNRFRAVFSFGPVQNIGSYGKDVLPFDMAGKSEVYLRSPAYWLDCIHVPVFVFEGMEAPSNAVPVGNMRRTCRNSQLQFHLVQHASHFSILARITKLVANRILGDSGQQTNITFDDNELNALFEN